MEQYPLETSEWEIKYEGKYMKAIGSRRMFEFILYLAKHPLKEHQKRYKSIEKKLNKIFHLPKTPGTIYHYLLNKEYMLSKYMVKMIDAQFLDGYLAK